MKVRGQPRFLRTAAIPVVGLLVLAGLVFDARPTLAQSQGDCVLPEGVTPPKDPRVTAQQVEDGSASLVDFGLAVKRHFLSESLTPEQGYYLGCLIRQEGSPWRSGSTYLVELTADGRVFLHAKDMSLSGGLLNPVVYGAILQAAGINPADLADPATAVSAFGAAAAGDGGLFAVPDFPGASGYATVYIHGSGAPIVLLAGFDLNSSHLVEEDIDYGDPTVTASDVVDRETLKAFVTQAGEWALELMRSGDLVAVSKARTALRDPSGPWRHGSVYLYVIDRATNLILVHGGFPDRYELRPLVGTVRDAVTGELVAPQIITAATSSPEGGFVQYHFDDPADDTDSADIPKVGYAREFSDQVMGTDGSVIPINLIVGSGFYLSAPNVVAARQNAVIESVLPQVMRAMTANTVDAISSRIQQAMSGTPGATTGLSLGGASTLSDVLLANGRALGNGTFDAGRLLGGSSFSLPLDVAGTAGSGPPEVGNLMLWGSGSYRDFAGGDPATVGYDGSVLSANVGLDMRLSTRLLVGLSVARAQGTVDYTASDAVTGKLTTPLTSINPYLGWQAPGGVTLWTTVGYGRGEVEVNDESADTQASDLTQQMVAAGVSRELVASERLIRGGTTSLRLKGETAFTKADLDGSGSLQSTMLNASRHRMMFEASHARKLASEATLTPSIEVGVRYDGGDGETGAGVDIAAGLSASNVLRGLSVDARVRTLLVHEAEGYEERGVAVSLIYDPTPSTPLGLTARVSPSWGGQAMSGARALWDRQTMVGLRPGTPGSDNRLDAELGYASPVGSGLVGTPRFGITSSGFGRDYRLGYSLGVLPGAAMNLHCSLDAQRRESLFLQQPDHRLSGRLQLTW